MTDSRGPYGDDLMSLFDNLYRRHKLAGKSQGTLRKHRAAIRHFGRALERPAITADLTDLEILNVMDFLLRKGKSPATCNSVRAKLVALWSFLARKGIVSTWPDVAEFVEPERLPIAWMPDELSRLWLSCAAQPGFICSRPAADWWLGLHSLLYDTGERIGATMQLTWGDVDLCRRWVTFRASTRKGKRKPNHKRLHEDTIRLLAPWQSVSNDRVFPWHLTMERLWQKYEAVLKGAGLACDRWHKFHAMRRTHASFFEAAGGDSSRSLGHSTREITRLSYHDPRIVVEQQASDVLFRPGPPEPPRAA